MHEMSPKGIQNDSSRGMDAFTQSFVGVLATQAAHWIRIHTMPLSFASATCRNACAVVTCISPHEESSKRQCYARAATVGFPCHVWHCEAPTYADASVLVLLCYPQVCSAIQRCPVSAHQVIFHTNFTYFVAYTTTDAMEEA